MDAQLAWPAPVPFRWPEDTIGALEADAAGRLLAAAGDIALVLDEDGVIRDVALGSAELAAMGVDSWPGQRWIDLVCSDSRAKAAEMLRERGTARRWRQINHRGPAGDVPIRYIVLEGGRSGGVVALGRDLRATAVLQQRLIQAQQTMERDHLRLRQAESRYRLLFDLSSEAMLILDGDSRRIMEANASAEALVGAGRLVGQPFHAIAQEPDREVVVAALGAASASDRGAPVKLRLSADGRRARIMVTFFRQGRGSYYLVRLTPEGAGGDPPSIAEVLNRIPDPFVLTDDTLTITAVNLAFLEITEWARPDDVAGRPLAQFVGRPGIDPPLMLAQLREHGSLRRFSTIAYGRFGTQDDVEISAVAAPDGERHCYGFTLRPVPARREVPLADPANPSSIEQLTQLVGRMSLKDIVRESTDLIERLCIEAALRFTHDNRASAAEILGLSRQGLYSKLHRHGLARPDAEDAS